jgi:malate dehydrogenase (oxaloacetate-decarboxylating)
MDYNKLALEMHKKYKGKIEIKSKIKLENKEDLSIAYTPGVAEPCRKIAEDKELVYDYTSKGNLIAVVSDGSAVLGLGNIGPEAGMPVMEGKAILFKEFANVDAIPLCIDTQDSEEIIKFVKQIAPTFGGINLEDISAPRCFEINNALQDIGIPVFHDDQQGTAVVVLAALINACKITKKEIGELTVTICGAGAAGTAIGKILNVKNILICDSVGIISESRTDLNAAKRSLLEFTNKTNISGDLGEAMSHSDVFIGVSAPNIVTEEMVQSMNKDPIVFAMANPNPEILPDLAEKAGAVIVGTGRSDFKNQINNVLAFPGIFRGALDARARKITPEMMIAAAGALADYIEPEKDKILPSPLDKGVALKVAEAVKNVSL